MFICLSDALVNSFVTGVQSAGPDMSVCAAPYVITLSALLYDEDKVSSLEKRQRCQKLYISISDTVIKKNDYQYLQLAIKILNQVCNRNMTYLYYMGARQCVLSQLRVRLLREDKCKS